MTYDEGFADNPSKEKAMLIVKVYNASHSPVWGPHTEAGESPRGPATTPMLGPLPTNPADTLGKKSVPEHSSGAAVNAAPVSGCWCGKCPRNPHVLGDVI
jgi:hypothetical protein